MNLTQALEIAIEYCWCHYPDYRKGTHTIKDFKLDRVLERIIIDSFDRLLKTWGEDNITPKIFIF